MFGKGQGVLGAWIKEFCQLVFIQTIQAFIYAIIISFVVKIMVENQKVAMDVSDYRTGLGLICVFAMVSVFKVEDLARKIFGFGPTKADHGGAVKSIAKTAFAMQLGKRVLDNGKKVVGGAGKLLKSNKDAAKARRQLNEDKADLEADMKGGLNSDFKDDFGDTHASVNVAVGTKASSGGSSAGASGGTAGKNYNQRIRALQRENEAKLSEIKKQRAAALKDMASGVLETGGALYGATAGAIIGGADGDLDETIQGLMAGAGLGDAVGQAVVNVGAATSGFVSRRVDNVKDIYASGKNIKSNYVSNREAGLGKFKSSLNAARKEIREQNFQLSKYKADIKELENLQKRINNSVDNAND